MAGERIINFLNDLDDDRVINLYESLRPGIEPDDEFGFTEEMKAGLENIVKDYEAGNKFYHPRPIFPLEYHEGYSILDSFISFTYSPKKLRKLLQDYKNELKYINENVLFESLQAFALRLPQLCDSPNHIRTLRMEEVAVYEFEKKYSIYKKKKTEKERV